MPTARIVCTGDELVRGLRINTNAAYLAKELCGLGILPTAHVAVSDNQEDIEAALACAAAEADVVLVTGGLGPTEDDRTRHALAAYLGQPHEENADALQSIQQRLSHYGRGLSESQHRQALLPNSAEWLPNSVGTAPGIHCRHDGAEIFCLPGPPAELEPMFTNCVAPRLKEIAGDELLVSASLHTFGAGEATV
ncbi:MAG: competence/damage-inducible protein A, partial [Phycisphaerae bacterium]|nr:competence/damage-inducible protein A [Phycisphaerae bacterium]